MTSTPDVGRQRATSRGSVLELRFTSSLGPAYLGRLLAEVGFDVQVLAHGAEVDTPNGGERDEQCEEYQNFTDRGKKFEPLADEGPPFQLIIGSEPLPRALLVHPRAQGAVQCLVRPGSDGAPVRSSLTAYARSGLMFCNGYPALPPRSVNGSHFEHLAAMMAFGACALALSPGSASPRLIEVSAYELACSLDYSGIPMWQYLGLERQQSGRNIGQNHPVSHYRCEDGFVFLNVVTQEQWQRLCAVMGKMELLDDPRFSTPKIRRLHAEALNAELDEWFLMQRADEVVERCQEVRVPCDRIKGLSEAVDDEQLRIREFWERIAGTGRSYPVARSAFTPPIGSFRG